MSRAQLLAEGVTRHEIERRTRDGRLQILHPGVYAVGHRALRPQAFRLAAVLAGGRDTTLSHRSAGEGWGWLTTAMARHEVTAPDRRRRHPRLTVYRNRLAPADVTTIDGIPITTPARTLLDIAATRPRSELDAALAAAARTDLLDARAIRDVLARNRGRRGVAVLRDAVAELHPAAGDTRSQLEILGLRLVDEHRLPRPLVNTLLHGYEVDLLWRDARLVVEFDSRTHHLTPAAFEADRRRDAIHLAAGYRTLRFTYRQVTEDPGFVAATLRAALRPEPRPATPPRAPAAAAA